MDETHDSTPGMQVQEQVLGQWERGFLAGVLAAWGVRQASPAEFRDAVKLLLAQREVPARPRLL